jgi:hypothetical protein
MQELNYRDPYGPDLDATTCQDDDWDDNPSPEQEDASSEEALFMIRPSCIRAKDGRFLP